MHTKQAAEAWLQMPQDGAPASARPKFIRVRT